MIPMDPKKAQKVGEEFGKVLTDSVFGIVDTIDKHKKNVAHAKAVNEANKGVLAHNKNVDAQQKVLKQIALEQIAKEQEIAMLQRMSPAERDAYRKKKTDNAKQKARQEKEEAENAKELKQLLTIGFSIFIALPLIIYFILFILIAILANTDRVSYRSLSPYIPGAQSVFGR
jgi:hypothetical protein